MIPNGPQLAFLWRTPAFDHDDEIRTRWAVAEERKPVRSKHRSNP